MNQLDYLASEFAKFEESPLNPLDSIALSQFCMVRVESIVPTLEGESSFFNSTTTAGSTASFHGSAVHFTDALRAELYETMFTGFIPDQVKENMLALAASPRFRDMVVRDCLSLFDTEQQTQFAAMTFVNKDEFAYIGFRGTDTSFTGWREDFNMAVSPTIPSQHQAVQYLEAVAPNLPERLYVGGHSKGGNLAAYAALRCNPSVQQRIERVYTHDGPGFRPGTFSDEDWARLEGRIHRTVPQESIVGMVMETPVEPLVVKSTGKGIMQHSPFTWEVEGRDFVYLDKISDNAQFTQSVLSEWLACYPAEKTAVVVEALFAALEASGAEDATDLLSGGTKALALMSEAAKNTPEESKDALFAAISSLTEIAARRLFTQQATMNKMPLRPRP